VPQPWLENVKRRTNEDIKERLGTEQIFNLITSETWQYKTEPDFYHARDKALMSLLFLTAGRISEVLSLTKEQFDTEADKNFIIIRNMILVKRLKTRKGKTVKHRTAPIRDEVPLPLQGSLSKFTRLVTDYLNLIGDPKDRLFRFKRHRAWQIVNHVTGEWCHWFRSQAESYYGKYVFNTPFALRDFVGVSDIESLGSYVKTQWRDYEKQLLGKQGR
jgi:integrase